jgi:hypothetical protein
VVTLKIAERAFSHVNGEVNNAITSGFDVVDGSSTGTRVPWMWALLRLPGCCAKS